MTGVQVQKQEWKYMQNKCIGIDVQQAHDVVMTSQRRSYDVILTSCSAGSRSL